MKLHHLFSLALVAVSAFMVHVPAIAVDPEQALLADFPPKSIDTVERAEDAIRRAPEARDSMVNRFTREKAECLERFFAASCLSDMRSRERKATKAVKQIEVEARAFLRRERAAERERAVAERELRAAQQAGKSIPYSGATRKKSDEQPAAGDTREPAKRVRIERVPESAENAAAAVPPADAAGTAPAQNGISDGKAQTPLPDTDGGKGNDAASDRGRDTAPVDMSAPAAPVAPGAPVAPEPREQEPVEAQQPATLPVPEPLPAAGAQAVAEPEPAADPLPVPEPLPVPGAPVMPEPQPTEIMPMAEPQPASDSLPVPEPLPAFSEQPMPEPQPVPETLPVSEPLPVLKPKADAEPQPAVAEGETVSPPQALADAEPASVKAADVQPVVEQQPAAAPATAGVGHQ